MKLYSVYQLPGLTAAQRAVLVARLGPDVDDTQFGPQSFEACMHSLDAGERADAQWDRFPASGATELPNYTDTGFVLAQ
jgi:hypothetical protein